MVSWFRPKTDVSTEWVAFFMIRCATTSKAIDAPIVEELRMHAPVGIGAARRELFCLRAQAVELGIQNVLGGDKILSEKLYLGYTSFLDLLSPPECCVLPPFEDRSPEGRKTWAFYSQSLKSHIQSAEPEVAQLLKSEGVAKIGTLALMERLHSYGQALKQDGLDGAAVAFARHLNAEQSDPLQRIGRAALSNTTERLVKAFKAYRVYASPRGWEV